jgi:5-(aminomethyl)-3-furanmethanol phosphate kinase
MPSFPPSIVKLGGSHAFSEHLPGVVAAIAASHCPLVVVPGGGPFADRVRELQPRMGLSDETAHRLALLAMCQYGEVLASLHSKIRPVNGIAHLREALNTGIIPVWMPWPLSDGVEALPPNWDITSDSLAAWLATRLHADRLLLIKSVDPPSNPTNAEALMHAGIVDRAFPAYVQERKFNIFWLGPRSIPQLTEMLDRSRPVTGCIG